MTADIICDLCGNPTDGYVCKRCTDETAGYLRGAELAGEVEVNVALQARYATRGGRRAVEPEEEHAPTPANRRNPVDAFGWQASRERPLNGALRPERLPVDLNASARAAHAFNHLTTWARAVEDDRGSRVPMPLPSEHPAAVAAVFLLANLEWMRHQQFAAEAFEQLRAAGATIRRIVDRPPDDQIVGICDCKTVLYAYVGASYVTCPTCQLRWDVGASRENLWVAIRGYLVTASEAALLLILHAVGGGDRRRWAKTITMWGQRGIVATRGEVDGSPVYLFAEIVDRATRGQQKPAA